MDLPLSFLSYAAGLEGWLFSIRIDTEYRNQIAPLSTKLWTWISDLGAAF